MIKNFMADKLIITFEQYTKIVEKLAIEIHNNYKPTVLVGIMRGAAPILDILSRILKLPIAYIVIQSYSGERMEDKQGELMFAREISSLAENKDFDKVLLVDDLSDTGLTLNKSIEWLKKYEPTKDYINQSIILTGQEPMKVIDMLKTLSEIMSLPEEKIKFSSQVQEGHYIMTPYSLSKDIGKKYIPSTHIDLGQGLLQLIHQINK